MLDQVVVGRGREADIALHGDGSATEVSWELRYEPRSGRFGRPLDQLLVQPVLDILFRTSLRSLRSRVEEQEARFGDG